MKGGGGVRLIFKLDKEFKNKSFNNYTTFEILDFKSMHIDKNLQVIIIYRSPSSSVPPFLDEFAMYLNDVIMTRDELLIAGDFNLHF